MSHPPAGIAEPVPAGVGTTSGRQRRMFHGWKVVGAGSTLLALQTGLVLQAFGTYAVVLREQFGFSNTTISLAYSANRVESGLLGPIHGWALQRFGSRLVMRVGAVIMLLGFVWFSRIDTPTDFVLSFFLVAIGAGLAGLLTVVTDTVHWFERKRSRALSATLVGVALGGLAAPLVVLSIRHVGWRETALASGVVLCAATLLLTPVFGQTPAERGEPLDGADARDRQGNATAVDVSWHHTTQEALRTRAFWLLAFGHMSALLVVGVVAAHLTLYLTEYQGYSLQSASFVVAGVPVAQLVGMAIGGVLGDRWAKRWICSIAMVGHAAGLLLLAFAVNRWMVWGFVVIHGLAWGARGPLMSAIRADYFGSTAFGQIMGYTSIILTIGMVGGPLLAGVLADVTGDYRAGFTILAILAASGAVLFALATPPDPAVRSADAESTSLKAGPRPEYRT